jgi:hypothetical protein
LDFAEAAFLPLHGMIYHARADHVEIDIDQTAMQVLVILDSRGVITIFPECSLTILALVVLPRRTAREELHALRNRVCSRIFDEEVDVIGCHQVVEHRQAEPLLRFKNPMQVTAPITRKR